MSDLPPLPARNPQQPRPVAPRPAASKKPDPRPIRVVYGAGAVAVVSVIAVGLVQPDYSSGTDATSTTDPSTDSRVAASDTGNGRSDGSKANSQSQSDRTNNQATVQVQHVTKYIHLKPGQTPPPGATVIQPGRPTPRVVVRTTTVRAANPPAATHHANPPANKPPAAHNPPPPPAPTPRPTVKTHQSGHP